MNFCLCKSEAFYRFAAALEASFGFLFAAKDIILDRWSSVRLESPALPDADDFLAEDEAIAADSLFWSLEFAADTFSSS